MYCAKCGTENKDDVKFCSKCGNDLKSVKVETERKGITGKLGKMGVPGFRSGKIWKMGLAFIGYFFIFMILLSIISPSNSDTNASPSTPQAQNSKAAQSATTQTPQKGTYNNPANVGETTVIKSTGRTFEVSVTEVVRGEVLNDAIATENMFNDKPQSGYDYAAVKVQIKYSAGEGSASFLGTEFSAFSEGVELDNPMVVAPKEYTKFSTGEIMPGGSKTGWIFYTVPQHKEVSIRFKPNMFIDNACYINIGQ